MSHNSWLEERERGAKEKNKKIGALENRTPSCLEHVHLPLRPKHNIHIGSNIWHQHLIRPYYERMRCRSVIESDQSRALIPSINKVRIKHWENIPTKFSKMAQNSPRAFCESLKQLDAVNKENKTYKIFSDLDRNEFNIPVRTVDDCNIIQIALEQSLTKIFQEKRRKNSWATLIDYMDCISEFFTTWFSFCQFSLW